MRKLIPFIIVALAILGCASSKPYKEPPPERAAKIRFIMPNPDEYYAQIFIVDPNSCQEITHLGYLSGGRDEGDPKRVGMRDQKRQQEGIMERMVEANERLIISARGILPTWKWSQLLASEREKLSSLSPGSCKFPIITPKAGAEYEYLYKFKPGICQLDIYELSDGPAGETIRQKLAVGPSDYMVIDSKVSCQG